MKIYIVAAALFCVMSTKTFACEICGCGNNNFQIGILPNFSNGFIGIRYSASQFNSVLKTNASEYSHDYYKTMEIWGGYNIKRLQVMAFVPYVNTRKESDDGVTEVSGVGDFLLLLNYKILNRSVVNKLQHEVFIGGGVKLPTGKNQVDITDPDFNIGDFNSQAGTGSTDYLLNITHNMSWNKNGVVTNLAYRINGVNSQDYRFGERRYFNSSYYYSIALGTISVKPSIGINYQGNAINHFAGSPVESSDGYNLNATGGVNALYNSIGINVLGFVPIAQRMYDGQTTLASKVMVGLTYSF